MLLLCACLRVAVQNKTVRIEKHAYRIFAATHSLLPEPEYIRIIFKYFSPHIFKQIKINCIRFRNNPHARTLNTVRRRRHRTTIIIYAHTRWRAYPLILQKLRMLPCVCVCVQWIYGCALHSCTGHWNENFSTYVFFVYNTKDMCVCSKKTFEQSAP